MSSGYVNMGTERAARLEEDADFEAQRHAAESSLQHEQQVTWKTRLHQILPFGILLVAMVIGACISAVYIVIHLTQPPKQQEPAAGENTAPLYFAYLGDTGRRGTWNQTELGVAMGKTCANLPQKRCDFVVLAGDNFYEAGVASMDDSHWSESFENVYSVSGLENTPFYAILGNHDYYQSPELQVAYAASRGRQKPAGNPQFQNRWQMPARFYSQIVESKTSGNSNSTRALFVFLDTNPMNDVYYQEYYYTTIERINQTALNQGKTSLPEQVLFLRNALNSVPLRNDKPADPTAVDFKIVVGHHPLYSFGWHGNNANVSSLIGREVAGRKDVFAYFSAHNHLLEHIVREDYGHTFHQFVSGAGSRPDSVRPFDQPRVPDNTLRFKYDYTSFFLMKMGRSSLEVKCVNWRGETCGQFTLDGPAKQKAQCTNDIPRFHLTEDKAAYSIHGFQRAEETVFSPMRQQQLTTFFSPSNGRQQSGDIEPSSTDADSTGNSDNSTSRDEEWFQSAVDASMALTEFSTAQTASAQWAALLPLLQSAKNYELDVCYSGGASGMDCLWTQAAVKAGHTCVLLSFSGHRMSLPQPKQCNTDQATLDRRIKKVVLNPRELVAANSFVDAANKILCRRLDHMKTQDSFRYIQRDYYQIVLSDSLYAIGWIEKGTDACDDLIPLEKTEGGTAWAIVMFALHWLQSSEHITGNQVLPIFMYCQNRSTWFQCHASRKSKQDWQLRWSRLATSPPTPRGSYTGIGSRKTTKDCARIINSLFQCMILEVAKFIQASGHIVNVKPFPRNANRFNNGNDRFLYCILWN